jgi:hypothetical protein
MNKIKSLKSLGTLNIQAPKHPKTDNLKVAPMTYNLLPLGAISSTGWTKDQLTLQANGLAGNLMNFYRYVNDSLWVGGAYEYSELHEAAPYWYNAIVPLAYSLKDQRLID